MKTKLLVLVSLVIFIQPAMAEWSANRASRTATVDTLSRIPNTGPGDELYKVLVTSCATAPGASFRIYDSSGIATSTISLNIPISTFSLGGLSQDCSKSYEFSLRISSAITYTTTGAGEVIILWNNSSLDREQ